MEGDGQPQKESNVFMEKKGTDQSTETNELTLPEKLCRFYVERPKLAFGMSVLDCFFSHNLAHLVVQGKAKRKTSLSY